MKYQGQSIWIVVGMVVGCIIGFLWPEVGVSLQPLAQIFIYLMLMVLAPLIFSALVVALAGGGPLRKIGSICWQTLGFAFVYTASMLGLGLLLGYWLQPGIGISMGESNEIVTSVPESIWLGLVPSSVFDAMARNDLIQIVVFSVLFGTAVNLAGDKGTQVLAFSRSLMEVCFKLTDIALLVAPIGVAGAMASVVGEHGLRYYRRLGSANSYNLSGFRSYGFSYHSCVHSLRQGPAPSLSACSP